MQPGKKPAAAAEAAGPPSSQVSEHADRTPQRVLEHARGHGGKLPSQTKDTEKKLYFQYRKLRSKTEEQLGPAGRELMKQILAAVGRPSIEQTQAILARLQAHGGSCGDNASPGAQAARKTRQKLLSPTADLTPRRSALLRTLAKKEHDLLTCHDCWKHCLVNEGRLPRSAGHAPTREHDIGRKFARLQARAQNRPASVSAESHWLLRRIQAEAGPLALVLQRQLDAERESADFARRHRVNAPGQLPRVQTQMGEGDSHCGSSPFPWFVNVGHVCYPNSVVTSLLHCAGPRKHLLNMDRTSELREALQDLARDYIYGIAEPAGAEPWHWDVLAPCRLVDAVDSASRSTIDGALRFDFGPQHDAEAVLGFLLNKTGAGAACFAAHAPGQR